MTAGDWHAREASLCEAYRIIARMSNALKLTAPLPIEPTNFYNRPFRVIHGDLFARAFRQRIDDPRVRAIAQRTLIGSVDQFSDSTDLLTNASLRPLCDRSTEMPARRRRRKSPGMNPGLGSLIEGWRTEQRRRTT